MTEEKPKENGCVPFFLCTVNPTKCTYSIGNKTRCKYESRDGLCWNTEAVGESLLKIIKQIGLTQILKDEI